MSLALREMRRAKVRFGLLIAAIGLLVFLILVQQALQDGLITSFVGAIRQQTAPVLVYSTDGQRTLQGSRITPPLEAQIRDVDGVEASGRIGQGTFTVLVGDADETEDAAVIGAEDPSLGGVRSVDAGRFPDAPGEAVGSASDFSVGDRVSIVPVGVSGAGTGDDAGEAAGGDTVVLEVVGLVERSQLQVTPTLFTSWDDYERAARAANPDAREILPNVIGLRPVDGVTDAELVERVNAVSDDADALTRADAADETPGVAQVRQSFLLIFLLYGLVVPLVTGLFFLIVTFQKSAALTLLRAVGVSAGALVRSLLAQVVVVVGGGLVLGTLLYLPLSQAEIGSISLRFDQGAVATWSALLLVLGLLSALVAARRVLRIDPVEATSGGGAR
jgi:putative ABC transport system permease protein